jgi:hypothetical protein
VSRSDADDQFGYTWIITYTSDLNAGDIPILVPDASGLATTSEGTTGGVYVNETDGNVISGYFRLSYLSESTTFLAHNATSEEVKDALEALSTVPENSLSIARSSVDYEGGFTWTVSFLDTLGREHEGDLDLIEANGTALTGSGASIVVEENRKGTFKEVQTIELSGANIAANSSFYLSFDGEVTDNISIPVGDACNSSVYEVQLFNITTEDTSSSGGDDTVSTLFEFQLSYGDESTSPIYANPKNGDCSSAASSIQYEIESLSAFDEVTVSYESHGYTEGCAFRVTFNTFDGNVDTFSVQGIFNGNTYGAIGQTSTAGDDTITVTTIREGSVDAIQTELEALFSIGSVKVDSLTPGVTTGECVWSVTFENNAGDLPLLTGGTSDGSVDFTACADATYSSYCVNGTSETLGGSFAMSFEGERSLYLPYDASARAVELQLEALTTITDVEVTRVGPGVNGEYTWYVTFLTELGDLESLMLDDLDLSGTVPTIAVTEETKGVSPPFDSLDGLPLGSASLTNLSDLSLTVSSLEQGVNYYVRVSASNTIGSGPYQFAAIPYVMPMPLTPTNPQDISLSVIDGTTLNILFSSPSSDGGDAIDTYRIEYDTQSFEDEVQEVRLSYTPSTEVQVISTTTTDINEVQLVHVKTNYSGVSTYEVQNVTCDASGGTFKFTFNGETTNAVDYDAAASDIEEALEDLASVNDVMVTLMGSASQACAPYDSSYPYAGFQVTFLSVEDLTGNMPALEPYSNDLDGGRSIVVTEEVQGEAPVGGSFRLMFGGSTTGDINATASASELLNALENLDSIPNNGVYVVKEYDGLDH